jgi:hypothetical protein
MPIEPERFQLSTRNNMARETPYNTSIRERAEEGDDDLGLSESENSVSAEMIRECTPPPFWGCGVVTVFPAFSRSRLIFHVLRAAEGSLPPQSLLLSVRPDQ